MDEFTPLQQCKRELPWRAYKYGVAGTSEVNTFVCFSAKQSILTSWKTSLPSGILNPSQH